MAKVTGVGSTLEIGTADDEGATAAGSDTFTPVGGIKEVSGPTGDKGEIDVTDLASTGREFLASLPDNGEIAFSFWHDETEATQTTMWGDFNDQDATHIRNWQVTHTDGTTWDVKGYIKSMAISGVNPDSAVEVSGSIRCSGGLTRTLS